LEYPEPPTTRHTLGYAKAWLRERLKEGAKCPCCNQRAQLYKRTINRGQARSLIGIYLADKQRGWVHVNSLDSRSREEGKLRYWGLLEEERTLKPDGGRSGYWRLTDKGLAFVLCQVRVPKYVYLYDDKLQRVDDTETISIRDALGKRFDYGELMRGGD
jgi:hypothetical protein